MKNRNIGFHHVQLTSGEIVDQCVVTIDEYGYVLNWHKMTKEEPFTEWIGGMASLIETVEGKLQLNF